MSHSFPYIATCLLSGVALIVLLTTRLKVPAFFALLLACFAVGLLIGMPLPEIIRVGKTGFGNIMRSLGIVIALGTTLGVLLEHTGSTRVMASFILRRIGDRRTPMAMNLTGYVVGLPLFCDSGYIVLSSLNESLARRTGISVSVMAVSLATGLYAVHCLVPPHPGATAAAGTIGVDFGKLLLVGSLVAIPGMLAGYFWAGYAGRRWPVEAREEEEAVVVTADHPSVLAAFLPVLVPVVLIALSSFLPAGSNPSLLQRLLLNGGQAEVALAIGVLLVLFCQRKWDRHSLGSLLQEGVEKAGGILVIIGAGGAFGAVLAAADLGKHLSNSIDLGSLGILFPFLLTFFLKTAQGSSTVAIITAASLVQPLLGVLGLDSATCKLFTVLAMGAGSMMISHTNDAYFWVISRFSGVDLKTMLRVYSTATVVMGTISFLVLYLVYKLV
jgi:gluconate:H+ symporter, GntP family